MKRGSPSASLLNSFFLLSLLFCMGEPGQAEDPVLSLGDRLFAVGSYHEAATEYIRYLYFHMGQPDSEIRPVYRRLGLALREALRWPEAMAALEVAVSISTTPREKDESRLDLAVTHMGQGQFSQGEFILTKVDLFATDPESKHRALFLLGVCNLYQKKWASARQAFLDYYTVDGDPSGKIREEIERIFTKIGRMRRKSPRLAQWLSTFVPGSGQIYAGDMGDGVNALAVNGGATWLILSDLLEGRIAPFVVSALTIFWRYYSGNRGNAKDAAQRYNSRLDQQWIEQIIAKLKEFES